MKPYRISRLAVLTSLLLYVFQGYARNDYQKKDSVANYYFYKNKAELAIIDSNYIESINLFKRAFEFKSPNPRELSNGLRLALILKDTVFARRCMQELAMNGLEEHITKNFMGEELTQSNELYQYLATDYDSLMAIFYNSNKPKLAVFLDSIYARDQAIRRQNYTDEELTKVDKNNIDSLIWFTHKYGFPSFPLLGFAEPNAGLGRGGIYWFILWHARNQEIGILDSIGLKAVMQGLYPPDEFAQAIDCKGTPCKYHMLIPGIAAELGNKAPILQDDVVNKNRSEIYLESIEDYKRKLLFMNSRKKTGTIFYWPHNSFLL